MEQYHQESVTPVSHQNFGKHSDAFAPSKTQSTKTFHLPTDGTITSSTHQAKLLLPVKAPANEVNVVSTFEQTLISSSKFADARHTAVYKDEVFFTKPTK